MLNSELSKVAHKSLPFKKMGACTVHAPCADKLYSLF
jgi:hypothetical protein